MTSKIDTNQWTKGDLENRKAPVPSFKKVTARGKRYVYLRGTDVALVSGFLGTPAELESLLASDAVSRQIAAHQERTRASMTGHRMDAAKVLHKITKARAGSKGRSYRLSAEAIAAMLGGAYDRCEVTGAKFDYGPKTDAAWKARPFAPSLDRISNKGGYEPDNVRLVCVCVNVAINEWGLANFEKVCRAFVARNG